MSRDRHTVIYRDGTIGHSYAPGAAANSAHPLLKGHRPDWKWGKKQRWFWTICKRHP